MQERDRSKRLKKLKSRESVWAGFKQEGGKTARVMPRTDLEKSEDRVGILGPQISVLFLVLQWGVPGAPLTPLTFFSWQSNKVPVVQHPHHVHPLTPLITYSNEHFTPGNPPPHLPADVDPKTGRWEVILAFFFRGGGWIFLFCMLGGKSVGGRISHAGAPKGLVKCQTHARTWTN